MDRHLGKTVLAQEVADFRLVKMRFGTQRIIQQQLDDVAVEPLEAAGHVIHLRAQQPVAQECAGLREQAAFDGAISH